MEKKTETVEVDIWHLLTLLWKKVWFILLAGAACGVLVFSYASFFVTPEYASSVKIYVNNSVYTENANISTSQIAAAQQLADTYMVILESQSVLSKVAEQTKLPYNTTQLGRMISAKSINGTEIFEVVVKCNDYRHAAAIANGVAAVLPESISQVVKGSSVSVVDYAQEKPVPVSPSYSRYAVLGALAGVILSVLVIILVDHLDTTVKTEEYLSRTYGRYPLLAVIPGENSNKSGYYKGRYQMPPTKGNGEVRGGGKK